MDKRISSVSHIGGTIRVPGDKSISHRALILGSMCHGDLAVSNLSIAADCAATMTCLQQLGIEIEQCSNGTAVIHGRGRFGFHEPADILDARNSGTTMRLLAALLSGQPFFSVITGDGSLRDRPMRRIIDPLSHMGAQIAARNGGTKPPLAITGNTLTPINYTMPIASAQVKSAILIAGLLCRGETTVIEKTPSRDHTERMLKYLEAAITTEGRTITVEGGELPAKEIAVPGDISSAFYFLLGAILARGSSMRILGIGLNPTRLGGITALQKMGADIRISQRGSRNNEPYGEIEASSSALRGMTIPPEMIPTLIDEIPAIALVATQAEGKTIISGAKELRFKESDRLHTTATELTRMGAAIRQRDDGLEIDGPTPLRGTTVHSHRDHRLAMTLTIAGLIADGETVIEDAEAIEISYPEFFKTLETLLV